MPRDAGRGRDRRDHPAQRFPARIPRAKRRHHALHRRVHPHALRHDARGPRPLRHRARSYKAVAQADRLLAVYSHYDDVDDACRAAKGPLFNKNDFLTELERPDTVDRFSMIYAPLALALSIIFALVSSLGRGEPVRFFWAFSAITIVAAPIGLLCAFGAGYKNIARRLLASGAALAGARQANLLRGTEEVVLAENDLFPTGSIELESIKAVGQLDETRILSCAAAPRRCGRS